MSIAEQFFNTKQNQVLQYAENLAFFGEESYVYKNAGLMKEVIANEVALLNPTTAYYAYLWVRENGYKAIDYFSTGLVIALYHSEYNMTYHFVLIGFNDDGSGVFINREPCLIGIATSCNGLEALNFEDYDIVHYLNGEKNWFYKWENKPTSNPAVISNKANPYYRLRDANGFLSGLDTRVKKLLKTFKEGYNFPILPISYEDFNNNTLINLGYRSSFYVLNENCINYYFKQCNPDGDSSIYYVGATRQGFLIEETTADKIVNAPSYRAGFTANGTFNSLDKIQQSGTSSVGTIVGVSPINIKIQF